MTHIIKSIFLGFFMAGFLAGCTVQPLHSSGTSTSSPVNDVAIEPVDTRLEQQVRNRLIFLLNGGEAEPTAPRYIATLEVTSNTSNLVEAERAAGDVDTTLASTTISGTLSLTDTSTGSVNKTFTREARVSYDKSTQLFANSRAEIDAENRAAVLLAEELRNLILAYIKSTS